MFGTNNGKRTDSVGRRVFAALAATTDRQWRIGRKGYFANNSKRKPPESRISALGTVGRSERGHVMVWHVETKFEFRTKRNGNDIGDF